MKRIISILLIFAMLLPMLLPPVVQSAEVSLENLITQQYDDFVNDLTGGNAKDGADRLVNHSLKGGGKLTMNQNDVFTKSLLSSRMYRASFIRAATVAIETMQGTGENKLFMRGTFGWYSGRMKYGNAVWNDNDNGNDDDDSMRSPLIRASEDPYTGAVNNHDDAMTLVVGTATHRLDFRKITVTRDHVTYRVSMRVYDTFDFQGADYTGDSGSLEQLLTWLGTLLSFGLLSTYDWSAHAELELTVPNGCSHSSGDYRWEFDGRQDLVSITTGGFDRNSLKRSKGTTVNGVFSDTVYIPDTPVRLNHDRPWVLEMRCAGTGFLTPAGTYNSGRNGFYLRKASNTLFFGESVYLNETDENKTLTHYGVWFTGREEISISSADVHTYRLDNRISEDGSNMVWLTIDGVELGPMNQYYHSGTSMKKTSDWVCGKDFVFTSFGGSSYAINNVSVPYIQVWENGEGGAPFSYCTSRTVAPTCTDDGYIQNTCTLCGAVFKQNDAPARGHNFGSWTVTTEASCVKEGTERRECDVCGEYETRSLAVIEHNWTASVTKEASCTESGVEAFTCQYCHAEETREIPMLAHNWMDPAVPLRVCSVCGYAETSCRIQLPKELAAAEFVWVDGLEYPVKDGEVVLHSSAACLTVYGEEMQVWALDWNGEMYRPRYVQELDGLLTFAGTELRTTGVPGIRILTAMNRQVRDALTGAGLAGYVLMETGTVTVYSDESEATPVLGQPGARSSHAYRQGESDPVFRKSDDRIIYTNVLVNYNSQHYEKEIRFRPYCILEKDGQQMTVYGQVNTATIAQLMGSE